MRAKCANIDIETFDQTNTFYNDLVHNTSVDKKSVSLIGNSRVRVHSSVIDGWIATERIVSQTIISLVLWLNLDLHKSGIRSRGGVFVASWVVHVTNADGVTGCGQLGNGVGHLISDNPTKTI